MLLIGLSKFATWHNQLEVLPDLGSDTSSVWNFCSLSSDIVSRGNQWWCLDVGCFPRLVFRTNLKIVWYLLICIKDPSDISLTSISAQSERGQDLGGQFHHTSHCVELWSLRCKVVSLHHKVDSPQSTFCIKQFKTI